MLNQRKDCGEGLFCSIRWRVHSNESAVLRAPTGEKADMCDDSEIDSMATLFIYQHMIYNILETII